MRSRIIRIGLLLLLFACAMFLTLNRHSKSGIQNYHSEIWSDKAGYYVYLPALFIYDFNGETLPSDIASKTGDGFAIDHGKIKTKYPNGVALMLAPFFMISHVLAKPLGFANDGFSLIYHKAIDIAAVVYAFLALLLLYFFLIRYVNKRTALITLLCLFLGTNVFYYSIFETGMSHIYSFFLFATYLYLSPFLIKQKTKIVHYLLFGLIIGLIVAVRPMNALFLPVFFIFNKLPFSEIRKNVLKWMLVVIAAIIVLIPQLLYWNYAYGAYFHYSYEGESFSSILDPKLLYLWFSTNNGLFTFNPLALLMLVGLVFFYKEASKKSVLIGLYFLFISYVFSSWHDWNYGCSYGSRPYVEYYTLFSLPFSFFIAKFNKNIYLKSALVIVLIVLIGYNLKLMFSYDGCWYGGNWDWAELGRILVSPTK